ncbi:MAG TPA: DUF559 domain-containing protein [Candidatus Binataceae bacterium]|nr:DUF559 domain-containing protein [Candidatus Binataceae bacterium]
MPNESYGLTCARDAWARPKSRRQVPIGPFIADFCSLEKRLIIELDGGHHADRRDQDDSRSEWLQQHGYRVTRFWNNEVFDNIEGVLERILTFLG